MAIRRVLFVDDDLVIDSEPGSVSGYVGYCGYCVREIEESGAKVEIATTPDRALEILRIDSSFDLIILDVMMPRGQVFTDEETAFGMRTGFNLAERIHREYPEIPIILLSNIVPAENDRDLNQYTSGRLMKDGIVKAFLAKDDCVPADLCERIAQIVDGQDSHSRSRGTDR